MSSVPEEIVVDILSRLPVKPLCRCKCVCKPWLHLITTDSDFAKLQLGHKTMDDSAIVSVVHEHTTTSFCFSEPDSLQNSPIMSTFDDSVQGYRIIGTCNGLLCITDHYMFHIWNPTTGDCVTLPFPPYPSPGSPAFYYFGAHADTNDYKVLRIMGTPHDMFYEELYGYRVLFPSQVCLYTTSSNTWRMVENFPQVLNYRSFRSFVNGAFHWHSLCTAYSDTIVSFNVGDEAFGKIPVPHCSNLLLAKDMVVSELGGLLCLSCLFTRERKVLIWVMKEYGVRDSWTELYVIELPVEWELQEYSLHPLQVLRDGKILFATGKWKVIVYDPESKLIQEFPQEAHQVYPIVRSLISPRVSNNAMVPLEIKEETGTKRKR